MLDGWILAFLFGIVLPSPSFYFYFNKPAKTQLDSEFDQVGFEDNPLAIDSGVGQDDSERQPPAARAKMYKLQREAKDNLAQIQQLRIDLAALRKDNSLPQASANRSSPADMEMLDGVDTESPAKTRVDMMKGFATDESLTEDAREIFGHAGGLSDS